MSSNDNIHILPHAKKRILKDVLHIIKNPLTEHGIYYKHDSDNMLKGKAVIIGPKDTIYEYGVYEFNFTFPTNYPFSPPKLKYKTNDTNNTRFHPNLYRNGKVCLSILNTWNGEQWTSCQTISTVLLTLTTLFHNNALLNEPGITKNHRDFNSYHSIIKFRNYEYALLGKLFAIYKNYNNSKNDFFTFIHNKIIKHKKEILNRIKKNINNEENDKKILKSHIYTMNAYTDYTVLFKDAQEIFKLYESKKK
jgi:ubiquitin-protein ligase